MRISVIGAAKSGIAAAELAQRQGHDVFVSESRSSDSASEVHSRLASAGIVAEFGGHSDEVYRADLIIVSPGVVPSHPVRIEADRRGIELIGELEYASRHLTNPIIAITGTNGKTTTTALTAYILQQSGRPAVAAGNIGTPLCSLVGTITPDTVIVAECSSYQLDTIKTFRPQVSMILNITPDHLAYHGTFSNYVEAKWKIASNQQSDDIVILNADDPAVAPAASAVRSSVRFFSTTREVEGAFIRGGEIVLRDQQHNEEILMSLRRLGLPGVHNAANSMASTLAARAFEVRNENIRDSLMTFSGVEHRLEGVRIIKGVRYVNDSKATNVNATWYALSSYDRPIVWIAGGRGDSNNYAELDELVSANVKSIVCIGEEADAIFSHWCTTKRCVKAETMEDAIRIASDMALADDVVLFSPACKSFDMFANYEERGRAFKRLVATL
ncbi:MAG: UDP-N-acetylmuramoyl-L-alanine--D-glutamate ligase [Candidatus Kapabacteria bacterium]|nr:UDP-N-acetylmuramoyl-L-alanine--D-glutamate ligase [Candidatus Kapabacteria bacterium]